MKLAIMQPYFLPYIGYFQLINCADVFIIYDDIKYTKKGWINRNRMLQNGAPALFSLPLKAASDFLEIRDRELASNFDREKLLRKISNAYRNAPMFLQFFPIIEDLIRYEDVRLFHYIHNSVAKIADILDITTKIMISSSISINRHLRGEDRVLAFCEAVGATTYINLPGGRGLYSRSDFQARGVDLQFLCPRPFEYRQFGDVFVPWLSILDWLMFNPAEVVQFQVTNGYDLF